MKGKGYRVTCGCVLPGLLSPGQMMYRAFIAGLTFGAFPKDYKVRERRETDEAIEHLLREHADD